MEITIKNRFNGNIILCGEYESIKDCLQRNRGADLQDADLHIKSLLVNNSVQTILTIINWGLLSDKMTLEMMRHDAESCGIEAMNNWIKTNICPFANSRRDYLFQEKKELWIPGVPELRGIELLKALCKEKNYKLES
jgi:hypothetical protein